MVFTFTLAAHIPHAQGVVICHWWLPKFVLLCAPGACRALLRTADLHTEKSRLILFVPAAHNADLVYWLSEASCNLPKCCCCRSHSSVKQTEAVHRHTMGSLLVARHQATGHGMRRGTRRTLSAGESAPASSKQSLHVSSSHLSLYWSDMDVLTSTSPSVPTLQEDH